MDAETNPTAPTNPTTPAVPPLRPAGWEPVDYPLADRIPEALHGPSSSLEGLTVLVTGLGVSGFPAAVHLGERGADVIVVDANAERDLGEQITILEVFDVDVRRGPEHVTTVPRSTAGNLPDLVVTSPGWRPDHPVLVAAQEAGIPVIGEVELAWRVRGTNAAPWLVVTGTNGKTTTTSMLASMLQAAGLNARACGNIGAPLLEAVLDPAAEVLAIELSSYQLHWQYSMSAHAAAVLNLADDHLDWHGGSAEYAAAKGRAYTNVQKAAVYNVDDPATRRLVEDAEVIAGARAVGFGLGMPGPGSFGLVEDVLVDRAYVPNRYSAAAELGTLADVATASGHPGGTAAPHQVANALAAAALARSLDVPTGAIAQGLKDHVAGGHRLEHVITAAGVTWIDDTKATNPHAADAALASFEDIVWIAGGLPKGAEYSALVESHAHRLRGVVLVGTDRAPLRTALAAHAPDVPVVEIEDLPDPDGTPETARGRAVMTAAVEAAAGLAADAGDSVTVLLAPAAASMDQFLDYGTRGDLFAAAVRERTAGDHGQGASAAENPGV
ncbi:UDP-N-acetylmuramoyl-L-alanine--D-glutamate ligase [Brevibacterium litoralis]|uniref:UDP-N-acetylmuramoyl-L-alanine--D-glutamate ligase n=1 Tax=Brevibacterium litoralis TaxID=3138935 RepID=UPI0032EFD4A2